MSLLSAIILPMFEKELIALQPEIANFALRQFKSLAEEVIEWAEKKTNIDINGDGYIGHHEDSQNE